MAGNDPGLSSANELQEWTLEKQETEQVTFRLADTLLKLRPLTNNAVRVIRSMGIAHEVPELVYLPKKVPDYVLKKEKDGYILSLKNLNVRFSVSDGRISFFSSGGKEIVGEEASLIESSSVQGEKTYVSTQTFHSPFDECLYGLGQFQDGYLNVRGLTRRLTQVNTQIAIPFVMSNKGYGLLWNNYGLTDFNPASSVVALQKTSLGGNKVTVNVTSTEGGKEEVRESNVFVGKLKVESDGQYALMLDVGSVMARRHNLAIDGHTVVDMNNLWLPPTVSILVDLKAGEHNLRAELTNEDAPRVYFRKVDENFLEELEEILIMSDIGIDTSTKIIGKLRERMKKEKIQDEEDVKQALREEMQKILDVTDINLHLNTKPSVILVVGVNGVGKTTSIGKMANRLAKDGKKVVVAAADTFRAAAVEQLEIWANRAGATVVKRDEGVDPASVVYDAIKQTKELGADILIVDTAGRLHNKKYLMDELNKIQKVINKEMADADKEVLLVIDGTTGQNAISQVKAFKQEADITGIVLTKLDGTAKGGVVIGIVEENQIPVKFIGVGEQIDDMEIFNSEDFVKAII